MAQDERKITTAIKQNLGVNPVRDRLSQTTVRCLRRLVSNGVIFFFILASLIYLIKFIIYYIISGHYTSIKLMRTKTGRKPEWLKKKIDFDTTHATQALLNQFGLNTVCQEAKCPNISECFKNKHATFLILGKYCTRNCAFCSVEKLKPQPIDEDEPKKVASAVKAMGLKHAVITSVTRDDLPDGGAYVFVKTVSEIRKLSNTITIELLIPDFKGDEKNIRDVAKSKPDIIGHNMETVPRLYSLRPQADYKRSLLVLKHIKDIDKNIHTKSALMLGLGEQEDEVINVMKDLRKTGCDFLALGQYLRPSIKNIEVAEYISPEQFQRYKSQALKMGFKHVESGPFVRSSYRATHFA